MQYGCGWSQTGLVLAVIYHATASDLANQKVASTVGFDDTVPFQRLITIA